MTDEGSVAGAVRTVARLRELCRRLPHIPTEQEERLLARFGDLNARPTSATPADVALAARLAARAR
jgi:hypothetical protein